MALQKCPDCGNDVSSSAPACPHCGRPNKKSTSLASGCAGVIVLGILVAIAVGMCSNHDDSQTAPPPAASDSGGPSATGKVSPSFDCTKALSQTEKLICSDPELSTLDAELAALYKRAKAAAKDKKGFTRTNTAEWKKRESTCADKQCLVAWYAERRSQLSDGLGSTPTADTSANAAASETNLTDAKALDEKYGIDGNVRCGSGSDDYLRSAVKYDFKWDDTGFLDMRFDKYGKDVVSPGVLRFFSDKLTIQNGFGAYQRAELSCDYDTQIKKVLRYQLSVTP